MIWAVVIVELANLVAIGALIRVAVLGRQQRVADRAVIARLADELLGACPYPRCIADRGHRGGHVVADEPYASDMRGLLPCGLSAAAHVMAGLNCCGPKP